MCVHQYFLHSVLNQHVLVEYTEYVYELLSFGKLLSPKDYCGKSFT